jgi:hypothetical protein
MESYQKAPRKRKVWVEPLFPEAKAWHGLRGLRLRGLAITHIQGPLTAAEQNLKRFLAVTDWGRRHTPCGSLVALPTEARVLSAILTSTGTRADSAGPTRDRANEQPLHRPYPAIWPLTGTSSPYFRPDSV